MKSNSIRWLKFHFQSQSNDILVLIHQSWHSSAVAGLEDRKLWDFLQGDIYCLRATRWRRGEKLFWAFAESIASEIAESDNHYVWEVYSVEHFIPSEVHRRDGSFRTSIRTGRCRGLWTGCCHQDHVGSFFRTIQNQWCEGTGCRFQSLAVEGICFGQWQESLESRIRERRPSFTGRWAFGMDWRSRFCIAIVHRECRDWQSVPRELWETDPSLHSVISEFLHTVSCCCKLHKLHK